MTVKDLTIGASSLTVFYVDLRRGDDIEPYDKGTKYELDKYTLNAPVLHYRAAAENVIAVTIF